MALADVPKVLFDDGLTAVVGWRAVVVSVWRKEPFPIASSRLAVEAMLAYGRTVAPTKVAVVVMLNPDVTPPNAELRAEMDRNARHLAAMTACGATIHSGTGFRAAAVRGVLTALQLVARSKHPEKVFTTDAAAAAWMTPLLRDAGMRVTSPGEVADALAWIRANVRT
ncbi:MAG: hypothetical protein U0414_23465 [Polyangiaceae bacterium]